MDTTKQETIAVYAIQDWVSRCMQCVEIAGHSMARRSEIARRWLPAAQLDLAACEATRFLDITEGVDDKGKPLYGNAESRKAALNHELAHDNAYAGLREVVVKYQIELDTLDAAIEADRMHARLLRLQAEWSVAALRVLGS